jgi:hypothetical protein
MKHSCSFGIIVGIPSFEIANNFVYFFFSRATGVAISMVAARLGGIIGNIVIATLLDMYCPAPTFIVAGLLIGKNKITQLY